MKKEMKKALIALGIVLIVSLAWIFRPYEKPNMREVVSELKEMKEPFIRVDSVYYLDGGTVGIHLIDSQKREIKFSIPAPLGEDSPYRRLFIGALHYSEEGSQEIENSHETKVRLAEILRENPKLHQETDIAIAKMTGRWRDYWRILNRLYISRSYKSESYPDGAINSEAAASPR